MIGVSTRAVRHYHRRGLLPEPARLANGYREYGLRDAIVLARIRRLTELGLSLDEVRDALAGDQGRDLAEILAELDEDLARQEALIRDRRARLGRLIERAEGGLVHADDSVSPEMAALFGELERTTGALPPSPMAVRERELLALLDTSADPEQRDRVLAAIRPMAADPAAAAAGHELHRRLDELGDATADDPRVAPLAEELAGAIPPGLAAAIAPAAADPVDAFGTALLGSFAPAQAEVIRRAVRLFAERSGS